MTIFIVAYMQITRLPPPPPFPERIAHSYGLDSENDTIVSFLENTRIIEHSSNTFSFFIW